MVVFFVEGVCTVNLVLVVVLVLSCIVTLWQDHLLYLYIAMPVRTCSDAENSLLIYLYFCSFSMN